MGSPLLERSRELGEGASATDDNAASVCAGRREPGMIHLDWGRAVPLISTPVQGVALDGQG